MAGRPKAKIDWNFVGKALEADCSAESIAASIGISVDTFYVRCKSDNKIDFSAFSQQKKVGTSWKQKKEMATVTMLEASGANKIQ